MGCDCTKLGTATRIVPVDEVTNHSRPVLVDNAANDQQPISFKDTIRQAEPIVIDDLQKNRDNVAGDGSIGQPDPIPLEDVKSTLTSKLVKQEKHASVDITTNYPTSTSVNNPVQTFEQRSAHESTSDHLSKQIDSGTSNKRVLSPHSDILDDDIVSISDASVIGATISALPAAANDHVDIIDVDPEAFSPLFLKHRQDAIDNFAYRSTIESWRPKTLKQLSDIIQDLSKNKSLIDRHWIIFYWIACNIEYDAVSYLTNNIPGQSADEVFRTKKGVCAGYSRLYKYLCDQSNIKCAEISGYAKGHGYENRKEGAVLQTNHAWNAVEIEQHWYFIDSTWGTGHLNQQNAFKRELNCFYFLTRPHQMIYDHLPEDDKWQLLREPIKMTQYLQMPKTHSSYFNLNLELISPRHQAHVTLVRDKSYALVLMRAPNDVHLIAHLQNSDGKKIVGGDQVYYNQRKSLWRCKFAPDQDGLFTADIFGKKKSDAGNYSSVISFKIKAIQIPSPPLSYPHTWQLFHDLNLKVKAPENCSTVPWPDNSSYVEILMRAPDDVQLSCSIHYNNVNVKNGTLAQFDTEKKLWQLLFAPERVGQHELIVFAKRNSEENSQCALQFCLNVTQLQKPMKFPVLYSKFHMIKGRIYEPINGILKKGATVPIHCLIPGAADVNLQVDSKWLKAEGYEDPILKRKVIVGSKDVTIYGKYGQNSSYEGLVKYSVQ